MTDVQSALSDSCATCLNNLSNAQHTVRAFILASTAEQMSGEQQITSKTEFNIKPWRHSRH